MDLFSALCLAVGMFISGRLWDKMEVHTPGSEKDPLGTVAPYKEGKD